MQLAMTTFYYNLTRYFWTIKKLKKYILFIFTTILLTYSKIMKYFYNLQHLLHTIVTRCNKFSFHIIVKMFTLNCKVCLAQKLQHFFKKTILNTYKEYVIFFYNWLIFRFIICCIKNQCISIFRFILKDQYIKQ